MPIPLPGFDHFSDAQIFDFGSMIIVPGWLVLLLLPRWSMRTTVVTSIVVVNCLVYLATVVSPLAGGGGFGGVTKTFAEMGKYDGVVNLFSSDDNGIILPAWVHYLAFDMIVGNYLVERNLADVAGLNQALMAPVVLFTLMAGPVGVVVYVLLKAIASVVGGKPKNKTT